MKKYSPVIVNLQTPREKVWGIVVAVQSSGITVKGIDLNSFDDWTRGVARGDVSMGLSTVFFPLHRVERVNLDERVGGIPSLVETFETRVGKDVWTYLGLEAYEVPGAAAPSANGFVSLKRAEADYLRRVLDDAEWDLERAAEILEIAVEVLEGKLEEHSLTPGV